MADNFKFFLGFVFLQVYIVGEQTRKTLHQKLAQGYIVHLLFPDDKLLGQLDFLLAYALGLGLFVVELLDLEVREEVVLVDVGVKLDGVLLHVCDVLVQQRLVDLPEKHVVMLLNSIKQLVFFIFLHLREDLVS